MTKRMYRSFQGLTLLALCIFLASKAASGQLTYYINLRFIPLTLFGIIILAILAQALFKDMRLSPKLEEDPDHEHDHDHSHSTSSANLWFMLLPLAIGVFIPARPLDSSAFSTKGFNTAGPLVSQESSQQVTEIKSQDRDILDWVKLFNFEPDLTPYIGEQASVIGFVYHDEQLGKTQFYVSRFVISCCAADGFAIALVVDWADTPALKNDTWVLVKGTVDSVTINERPAPLIHAESVQVVPIPEQPYIFP